MTSILSMYFILGFGLLGAQLTVSAYRIIRDRLLRTKYPVKALLLVSQTVFGAAALSYILQFSHLLDSVAQAPLGDPLMGFVMASSNMLPLSLLSIAKGILLATTGCTVYIFFDRKLRNHSAIETQLSEIVQQQKLQE